MSCWCGHGPWHRYGYPYPPPGYYPPEYYEPAQRPRPRRRAADTQELAEYLAQLEQQLAAIRREVEQLRGSESTEP
jgi:hypothetical protein